MARLELDRLTRRFGGHPVVDEVSLDVADGELIGLLGPSGCGKTTTLRMIAGFLPPSAGEIRVGTRVLSGVGGVVPPAERRMSMVFQSYALWPHMTLFENVAFGLRMRKVAEPEISRRVRKVLGAVQLEQLAGRYPSELSGGQQQRVALARAVVVEPETLLLDEPLSNLDTSLREEMRFEIRRLHDEFGITSVYVTHDLGEAMVTANRIAVMNAGHIEQVGTPEEIYDRPRTPFVASFIGSNNVLPCRLEDGAAVIDAGRLGIDDRTGGPATRRTGHATLAIRPHDVELLSADPGPAERLNLLVGRVKRHTYLGTSRDYVIAAEPGDTTLRVIAPPGCVHAPGAQVWMRIAPWRCRVLEEGPMGSAIDPPRRPNPGTSRDPALRTVAALPPSIADATRAR